MLSPARLNSEILPKINGSGPTLDQLAKQVRAAHAGVVLAATNLVEHVLAAGDALLKAKEALGHGGWLVWFKRDCDLSERTAQRYMQLAKSRAVLEANPTRMSDLSLTGALRLLKPPRSEPSHKPPEKRPTSLDALAWWGGAFLEQRQHFIAGVGLPGWLAAMPADWRPLLESRISGHLSASQLVDLLESRLERDGSANAARRHLRKIRGLLNPPRQIELKAVAAAAA